MSIETAADRLANVINKLGCLQVGQKTVGARELTYLCRYTDEVRWTELMTRFLMHEKGWQSFIAKTYFTRAGEKTGDKNVVSGWYLAFRADDIEAASEEIAKLLLSCVADLDGAVGFDQVSSLGGEVLEVPLVGVTKDRNTFPGAPGKGATATH